jgi:hypothetical protein
MRRATRYRLPLAFVVLVGILGWGSSPHAVATVGGTWTLTIRARLCPKDYPGDAYAVDCSTPFPGVAFSTYLAPAPAARTAFVAGDDGTVSVDLNGPSMERTIQPTLTEGIASLAVFCTGDVGEAFDYRLIGNWLRIEGVGQDDTVACDWYFVPWEPRETSLTLTVYTCPPGMTRKTLNPDQCLPITEGFDVAIGSLLGLMDPLTVRDAFFDGTSYTWDLGQAPPPSAHSDRGNYDVSEVVLPPDVTSYAAIGDAIRRSFATGYAFEVSYAAPAAALQFYDFAPDPADAVSVLAVASSCPTTETVPAKCKTLKDVAISVKSDGYEIGGSPFVTAPNPAADNAVSFTVPSRTTLTLTELGGLPAGVGPAPGYAPLTVAVADLDAKSCGESRCAFAYIINIPGGAPTGRTLTIAKSTCPPGYRGDRYAVDCGEPGRGVPFRIGRPRSDAFTLPKDTDVNGRVSFYFPPGMPLDGRLAIVERRFGVTERHAVFCKNDVGHDLNVTVKGPSTYVEVDVGEKGNVACAWFNIPSVGNERFALPTFTDARDANPGVGDPAQGVAPPAGRLCEDSRALVWTDSADPGRTVWGRGRTAVQ